jgi:recombinational DNA repair ATPase RecF
MIKIESLNIKQFRGVKEELSLDLNSKSVLLFGDNGAGKSSISDAIEWFYKNSVEHLSIKEIDAKGGLTALWNAFIADTEKSLVDIKFTNSDFDSQKSIILKKSKPEVENSNSSNEFKRYIENSENENLILRYRDLTHFILSTPKDKLDALSKVIGFTKISDIRGILKKATNEIKKSLKAKNYDNEISIREGQIMTLLNERIVSDEQYINKINEIIKPLKLDFVLTEIEGVNNLLSLFKKSDDSIIIEKRAYYNDITSKMNDLQNRINNLLVLYEVYYQSFQKIVQDIETLKKIALGNLWSEGLKVLGGSIIDKDECPLCFQPKSREELKKEIELRLSKLDSVKEQRNQLDDAKKNAQNMLDEIKNIIVSIQSNRYFNLEENEYIRGFVNCVTEYISLVSYELSIDILKGQRLKTKDDVIFDVIKLNELSEFCQKRNESLESKIKGKKILEAQDKITLSRQAYCDIKRLKREKEILEKQNKSMATIYNGFVQKQKEELELFINRFSNDIDTYYQYMHPGEKVGNIEIKTIEKEDELIGITIEFQFFNQKVSPPQKYLSESHLNSLGIAFYLASVKAFNKANQYFILDDIVSSFDSNHRKRLCDLLLENFSDYQIFVMTHERDWFDYMKNIVKGKADWIVNVINWNESRGAYFDEKLVELKRIIEQNLVDNKKTGLGNLMRKYLEKLLKEISEEIEVYVKYRSNELNENRMCNELLSELKSKINKQPLNTKNIFESIINKLLSSTFIANKDSHYSSFDPSIGDCRAFWDDLVSLEILFYCKEYHKPISKKYYDKVEKKIRCGRGHLEYDWNN